MSTANRSELTHLLRQTSWVRRLAGQLARDDQDAEDLVQDLWVEGLASEGGIRNPRAWVTCVLRRLVSSSRARESRRRQRERLAARDEKQDGPEELLEAASLQRDLANALMRLEDPVRTTVLLRYFEDLPPRKIAVRMEVPVRTVNSRLARGMVLLRERLDRVRGGRLEWFPAVALLATRGEGRVPSGSKAGRPRGLPAGPSHTIKRLLALSIPPLAAVFVGAWAGVTEWGSKALNQGAPVVAGRIESAPERSLGKPRPAGIAMGRTRRELHDGGSLPRDADPSRRRGLDGMVVTTKGTPIPGARIEVRFGERTQEMAWRDFDLGEERRGGNSQPEAAVHASPEGGFHLSLEPGAIYDLRVSAAGFETKDAYRVRIGDSPRIVLHAGGSLEGTIRREWDGKPAVGARVLLTPGVLYQGGRTSETRTDTEGHYRLDGLPVGQVRLEVTPRIAAMRWGLPASVSPGRTTHMDVVVPRGRRVVGRVVSAETGEPVAGARVGLTHTFYRTTQTDGNGDFVLSGADGSGTNLEEIRVKADGFGFAIVRRSRDSIDQPLLVELLPGRRAHGRVVRDDGGGPVAGVEVVACGDFDWRSTRTDAQGRFDLTGLRSDRDHSLFLRKRGFASSFYDFPEDEGETSSLFLGDVPLLPSASLSGRVVDESGKAVSHVFVFLRGDPLTRNILRLRKRASSAYPFRPLEVRTDERGGFLFVDFQPGSFELNADVKGYAGVCGRRIDLDVGESKQDIVLVLDRGKEISGRVFDPKGGPAGGWILSAIRPGETMREVYTIVAPDGGFRLWGLAGEDCLLQLDDAFLHDVSASGAGTRIEVFAGHRAGDTGIELRLPAPARVAGVFLDPGDRPVARGVVNLYWDSGVGRAAWIGSAVSDEEGRFSFSLGAGDVVRIEGFEVVDRHGEGTLAGVGRLAEPLAEVVAGCEGLVLRVAR